MGNQNEKLQSLLTEYGALREEILMNQRIISQWLFAVLPFASAVYIFTVTQENPFIPLFAIVMTLVSFFYIQSRLRGVLYLAAYLIVYVEQELKWVNWEVVVHSGRGQKKPIPPRTSPPFTVLYFDTIMSIGVVLACFFGKKAPEPMCVLPVILIVLVFLMFFASYTYLTLPETQKRYIEQLEKRKNCLRT
ncbi:hypothetical protein ES702_04524 [subsurface metagenome]